MKKRLSAVICLFLIGCSPQIEKTTEKVSEPTKKMSNNKVTNKEPLVGYAVAGMNGVCRKYGVGFSRGEKETAVSEGKLMTSFHLKAGHMATLAVASKTDKKLGGPNTWEEGIKPFWKIKESQVFIALKKDLKVDLGDKLGGKVNWIRVVPFKNVTKKGLCTKGEVKNCKKMNATWYYRWRFKLEKDRVVETVPMTARKSSITNNALWDDVLYNNIDEWLDMQHLSGFNEPDQANMTPDEAIAAWPRLLESGARLGSPAPKEKALWLKPFMAKAKAKGYRVDYMCLHWYNWWGYKKNPDPEKIFTTFKAAITKIHKQYGLPIWLTEFNANKNRKAEIHEGFLKLALPWIEKTPWI